MTYYSLNNFPGSNLFWERTEFTRQMLNPLLRVLKDYDKLRMQLMDQGGKLEDMVQLRDILRREFNIGDRFDKAVSLVDQRGVKRMLHYYDDGDLILDIKQHEYGFPIYYLCKAHTSYDTMYNAVVEDLYRSPDYEFYDNRLVKLMDVGHQYILLRMSPYRKKFMKILSDELKSKQSTVDFLLSDIGTNVLQYAWHEDQNIGIYCSEAFDLPNFRKAIELVYVCLTADLCDLRSNTDSYYLKFFQKVYRQDAIHDFLCMLLQADDLPVISLQQTARATYSHLLRAFNDFLSCKVDAAGSRDIPAYKLILGNIFRLNLVWNEIRDDPSIQKATRELEEMSSQCISDINSLKSKKTKAA